MIPTPPSEQDMETTGDLVQERTARQAAEAHIKAARQVIRDLKVRIAYIGHPKEPRGTEGQPTWGKEIAAADAWEAALAEEPALAAKGWTCKARLAGTAGGNAPQDCDWPFCGCDPAANNMLSEFDEMGLDLVRRPILPKGEPAPEEGRDAWGRPNKCIDCGHVFPSDENRVTLGLEGPLCYTCTHNRQDR